MGDKAKESFEHYWPGLAGELRSMLRGRGVPPWLIDDVAQETGVKLWRMWDDVDPARPLAALAQTIAVNVLRDYWRQAARREVPGPVPDRVAASNVETEGLAKAELRAVGRALRKLQPSYRSALLGEIGLGDHVTGGAARMLRLRARRELAALVDRTSGFGVLVGHKASLALRDVVGRIVTRLGPREAEGLACAAVGLMALVVVGGLAPGHVPDERAQAADTTITTMGASSLTSVSEDTAAGIGGLRQLTHDAVDDAKALLKANKHRPLARGKLGQFGEIKAEAEIESIGLRAGTGDDGSLVVGCADGTETGATEIGKCDDLGHGKTRAEADIRYRLGGEKGRLRVSTDRE